MGLLESALTSDVIKQLDESTLDKYIFELLTDIDALYKHDTISEAHGRLITKSNDLLIQS